MAGLVRSGPVVSQLISQDLRETTGRHEKLSLDLRNQLMLSNL